MAPDRETALKAVNALEALLPKMDRRRRRDMSAPKRPKTAYQLWSDKKRPEIVSEHPNATFSEIQRMLGDRWRATSQEKREKFFKQAGILHAQYEQDVVEYKLRNPIPLFTDEIIDMPVRRRRVRIGSSPPKPPPRSAYLLWYASAREKLLCSEPDLPFAAIGQRLSQMWASTPDKAKERCQKQLDQMKAAYEQQYAGFLSHLPAAQQAQLMNLKRDEKVMRVMRRKIRADKSLPKRPPSTYLMWLARERPLLRLREPSLSFSEVSSRLGAIWRSLSPSQKAALHNEREGIMLKYKKDLAAYRERRFHERLTIIASNGALADTHSYIMPPAVMPFGVPMEPRMSAAEVARVMANPSAATSVVRRAGAGVLATSSMPTPMAGAGRPAGAQLERHPSDYPGDARMQRLQDAQSGGPNLHLEPASLAAMRPSQDSHQSATMARHTTTAHLSQCTWRRAVQPAPA